MFKQGLILVVALTAALGSGLVQAEKPEWAGQGGGQREEMRDDKNAQGKYGDEAKKAQAREETREMEQKHSGAYQGEEAGQGQKGQAGAGQAKQQERVMEQEQKELGKGSEQGQESREQSRKWWRFWE